MRVLVEADGGSRGNPGPAGYGAVVKDPGTGEVLAERAEGIGEATNNVAEYQGLLAGLRAAAELGATEVECRLDSKLVVEQLAGRWKIKHPALQPLAREAQRLAAGFDWVGYTWIPRERNTDADRLANEAMDAQASGTPRIERADSPLPDLTAVPQPDSATQAAPPSWTGAKGTPTRLILLRHGQTEMSAQRRYSGLGDPQLTEIGRRQAAAAAKRLSSFTEVSAVIASPLTRTRQTAQAVGDALGLAPEISQGLVETNFGAWEGLTFTEAARRDPALHARWLADPTVPTPGGESFDQVHRRVARARDEVLAARAGQTVVLVSHVTPIKSLLRLALDVGPQLLFRLHLDLASISIAEFYPDGNASVRLVNDTAHLD
ncbi:broad specificity phosphatase PhoE/ribonuclease HI [Crossiella cryophila]|uniref:Broad specificity phosphatase PhoE/ribonuclease HI n=1 Tax=Crossiella cryophila TaxID=43355 RepID=A0A7W7C8P9_9PSEU|nr:broad specificity phosphatase PhoE/ribonuclease HI [Crossiella cryophila]